MNQLHEILKSKREERKWNKSQMARQLDVSSQLYGQYEKGEKKPGSDFFVTWKQVFGEDLTSRIETKVSNNGSVVSNKPQHGDNSQKQGLDLIKEVNRIREQQLTIEATISVILSELVHLIAKDSGRSHASVSSQLKKDVLTEIENLRSLDRKLSGG